MIKPTALVVTIAALGLVACSPPQPLDLSINSVPTSEGKVPCKLQDISVNIDNSPNQNQAAYGSRPTLLTKLKEPMQSALEDGLNRSASFNYNANAYCSVDARILGMKYELVGVTFPTNLYVLYQIINLNSGQPIMSEVVKGHGATPFDYNFVATVRQRHSLILSGQNAVQNMVDATAQFASTFKNSSSQMPQSP